jgi:glycosyltransferase involved in cell wall biosynthesis
MQTQAVTTFTCFTPTYNRAAVIRIVYDSLAAQTFRNFEWLVVDDGSTDGTRALVEALSREAAFPVRYVHKENGGMHSAINLGAREARGRFFLKCDSDDTFEPDSLERFESLWVSIPEADRDRYAGVTVHCKDAQGRIVGDRFPAASVDGTSLDLAHRWRIRGEKWGFVRTELLREFPFPEFEGEKRVPPSIVWNRIAAAGYLTRFADIALRTFIPLEDGITLNSARSRAKSWRGSRLFYDELMAMPVPLLERLKAAANYLRFCLHGGESLLRAAFAAQRPALALAALGAGWVAFRKDRKGVRDER